MIVTGSLHADLFARPGSSGQRENVGATSARPAPASSSAPAANPGQPEERPAFFSMISTISPGSLAAAYQVMRSRDAEGDAAAGPARGEAQDRAILSGLGIPSALDAYGEVLETD